MTKLATKMTTGMSDESTGGRLVTADGRTLALRGATLRADARGGVARVVSSSASTTPSPSRWR